MPDSFCEHNSSASPHNQPVGTNRRTRTHGPAALACAKSGRRATRSPPWPRHAAAHQGAVEHTERALDHHEVQEVQRQDAHAAVRILHGLEPIPAQQPGREDNRRRAQEARDIRPPPPKKKRSKREVRTRGTQAQHTTSATQRGSEAHPSAHKDRSEGEGRGRRRSQANRGGRHKPHAVHSPLLPTPPPQGN
jgi:hypothetical protein